MSLGLVSVARDNVTEIVEFGFSNETFLEVTCKGVLRGTGGMSSLWKTQ